MGKQSKTKANKKSKSKWAKIPLLFLILTSAFFLKSTFFMALIALLPSIVAHFADTSHRKSLFSIVVICNIAGVLPYVADAIVHGNRSEHVVTMMENPMLWLIVYLSAAMGWILSWGMPHAVEFFSEFKNTAKVAQLRRNQDRLVEEWGTEIQR